MGVLHIAKLAELLNAGDLQRCGCAEVLLKQFFTDLTSQKGVKAADERYLSSHIPSRSPWTYQQQGTEKRGASTAEARGKPLSDGDYVTSSSLEAEVDDELVNNDTFRLFGNNFGLGPEESPAKTGNGSVRALFQDLDHKARKPQPISWELPPLAGPEPISAPAEDSLLFTGPVAIHTAVPASRTVAPVSGLLLQALNDVALEARRAQVVAASQSTSREGNAPTQPLVDPKASDILWTRLAHTTGQRDRKLSAAELWLGREPTATELWLGPEPSD